jgi:hypothetical protein
MIIPTTTTGPVISGATTTGFQNELGAPLDFLIVDVRLDHQVEVSRIHPRRGLRGTRFSQRTNHSRAICRKLLTKA